MRISGFFAMLLMQCFLTKNICADWDANAYHKGNTPQERISLELLKEISLENKHILDVGCGTGNISAYMAEKADKVLGIDKSENMVNRAITTYFIPNKLEFEVLSAEEITDANTFDLVTFFFCVNWFTDKTKAFKNFYNALKPKGRIFGTIRVHESLVPNQIFEAFTRILPQLKIQFRELQNHDESSLIEYNIPSKTEVVEMLKKAHFENISVEPTIWYEVFRTKESLAAYITPIIMSTKVARLIPEEDREIFLQQLIDNVADHLIKNEDGYFLYPLSPARVHAQKI